METMNDIIRQLFSAPLATPERGLADLGEDERKPIKTQDNGRDKIA